ncbi:hypothetical protein [Streptomyces sp. NRRL B-1347]|uniref:hypothetical protein n=1 Tax=Streptomyces sp. NRRL B-1347 TaxID=1476877 RepID=UPI0004CC4B13|nr:hypothetical protein [Streptomyces sp. NRRL B-1347]
MTTSQNEPRNKTRKDRLRWDRGEDADWAATVEVRLVLDHNAPAGLADAVLAEVHELVREEGRTAQDLFGAPEAYARSVADERVSEEYRARTDTHGLTPGERLAAALGTLGVVGVVLCAISWVRDGLWVDVSWPAVVAVTTIVLAVALAAVAVVARSAGRFKGAYAFAAGVPAVIAAGGGVGVIVPEGQLFSVPVPVLLAGCAAWTVGTFAVPERVVDRWFAARPPAGRDDAAWLALLGGLLRGRHGMTTAEARGHVREARQHLAAVPSGEHADDVFGDVEIYALRLAEGPRREQRAARRKMYGTLLLLGLVTMLFVDRVADSGASLDFWLALYTGAVGSLAWTAVSEWRASRRPDAAEPDGAE